MDEFILYFIRNKLCVVWDSEPLIQVVEKEKYFGKDIFNFFSSMDVFLLTGMPWKKRNGVTSVSCKG